ncbi:peptidase inhibitor family I36 protein [Jiangella anatolica]|nr:peptidase inhibitor family I36 protein [Jiangella anatolica]
MTRRLLATLAAVATTVLVAAGGAHAGVVATDATPTGPLAAEMADALEQQPGGVQLSDNAMAWDDGEVIVVWPSPGEDASPVGLGDGVRADAVEALGVTELADLGGTVQPRGSTSTCPSGYYCFYTSTNFDGARYQFTSTCSAFPSSYGFDNDATSWVNKHASRNYHAYDTLGGTRLWTMTPGTSDNYVGSSADNRMSYWTCTS